MRRLVYISRSLVGTEADALNAIVRVASARNAATKINGILWAGDGEFVQALEGDHDEVGRTLERIVADTRHTDIEIVCDCAVQSRMFGSWAMIRSDRRSECVVGAAYLIGYAGRQHSPAAQRMMNFLLDHEEPCSRADPT